MLGIMLTVLYIISCLVLIMFVLLQPSKSDASQVFGGGASSTAFGPRGTQSVLAKITITAAIVFFMIAFLFSIPGLFDTRSLGEGVPADAAPVSPLNPPPATEQPPPSNTAPAAQPASPTNANQNTGANKNAGAGSANNARPASNTNK